jgi:hypothetical protein
MWSNLQQRNRAHTIHWNLSISHITHYKCISTCKPSTSSLTNSHIILLLLGGSVYGKTPRQTTTHYTRGLRSRWPLWNTSGAKVLGVSWPFSVWLQVHGALALVQAHQHTGNGKHGACETLATPLRGGSWPWCRKLWLCPKGWLGKLPM